MLNRLLARRGLQLVRRSELYKWQVGPEPGVSHSIDAHLPDDALRYLRRDNEVLLDLERRYAAFDARVTEPLVWGPDHLTDDQLLHFRGDNAYVWQLRGGNMNELSYALTAYYVESIDTGGLLDRLSEDRAFGNYLFTVNGRAVSRDLLDSIVEMAFLDKHLDLTQRAPELSVLDIGAGYGRLAHRMVEAHPTLNGYACTDAVAASTFVSGYYLRFRGVDDRAAVIPLDEVERVLAERAINVAVNIHSFSECRAAAIDWWVSRLAAHQVRHLFIAPNALDSGGERLTTNSGEDMEPILEAHGYRLVAREPKYRDPLVQAYGVSSTWHHLFELT